jgi:16S rRNA (guanine(527)-N(7))-methyltransferase RsmG
LINKDLQRALDTLSFRTTCAQNGLPLSEGHIFLLEEYARRLLDWNKKINVISRRDEENFWTSHALHCLTLLFKFEIPQGAHVLDLGTGGGLPGVVLKIVRPDLRFTLLDSTQKKINVVQDMIESLHLVGIETVWGRAEDVGREQRYSAQFDFVVARAVAQLKDLVRWSLPFLKNVEGEIVGAGVSSETATRKKICGPALIAFKGGDLEGEIRQLGGTSAVGSVTVTDLTLVGSTQLDDNAKKIVVVEFDRSRQ